MAAPDMELVDQALGHGDEADSGVGEVLVERSDVGKVPGQTVEALGDDDLERSVTGVLQELLVARAEGRGAADRRVGVDGSNMEALELGVAPAHPDLVIDRGVALVLGAEPGVDGRRRSAVGI